MINLDIAKSKFSDNLKIKLFAKYKKSVSVTFFVNEFNLRAHGTNVISYETGRKWLKGKSIPETSNMKVLSDWLGSDIINVFDNYSVEQNENIKIKNPHNLLNCINTLVTDLSLKNQLFLFFAVLFFKELDEKEIDIDFPSFINKFDIESFFKSK